MKSALPICHLTSAHPVLDDRIFFKEALTLTRAGYAVSLISQNETDRVIDGVRITGLPCAKNRMSRLVSINRKMYRLALRQKALVYHFHDPEFLLWANRLKKKTSKKIIYDVHEDLPKQILSKHWLPGYLRKPLSILIDRLEKNISRKFDFVITATPHIKKNFRTHRTADIKNYPLLERLIPAATWSKPRSRRSLIYAGVLEEARGTKEIIKALRDIDPDHRVTLTLAGEFSEKTFKQEVSSMEEWDKVRYLGLIPHRDVYRHLSLSDIGLVCLHPLERFQTALPVKMFEYMGTGIPVIASDFPLWRDIIVGNGCGLCVDPLSSKEIAKAVEYLINHPHEARRMGENGRKAVLEKFNWENEGKKLLKIYRELI